MPSRSFYIAWSSGVRWPLCLAVDWLCLGVTSLGHSGYRAFSYSSQDVVYTAALHLSGCLLPPEIFLLDSTMRMLFRYLTIICTRVIMKIHPACLMPTGSFPGTLLRRC